MSVKVRNRILWFLSVIVFSTGVLFALVDINNEKELIGIAKIFVLFILSLVLFKFTDIANIFSDKLKRAIFKSDIKILSEDSVDGKIALYDDIIILKGKSKREYTYEDLEILENKDNILVFNVRKSYKLSIKFDKKLKKEAFLQEFNKKSLIL